MPRYNPKKIEPKWQKIWQKSRLFEVKNPSTSSGQVKKRKFYVLVEFPYPSGEGLHVGHCRSYIALDAIARKKRMQEFNVLFPMGWDAFGLPTENYAIKKGIHPSIATKKNTDNFRKQIKSLGTSFDWSREINTTDPKYYKWTQWIFIKLFEKGLAYKDKININWCPSCKIGLANEEVKDGKCERCESKVEKREKEQWLIRITKYADRLIRDLDLVDYPERVKIQQKEWIGRSEGSLLKFQITNHKLQNEFIEVFTTRPDTLFGCTFLVLAPEHQFIENSKLQITNYKDVEKYVREAENKSDLERKELKDKSGVELKGVKAINPANGEKIPIFVADYVMLSYGKGAIMAVPAHDKRDYAFAKKYNLPIREVILPNIIDKRNPPVKSKKSVERKNVHAIVRDVKTNKYLAIKWEKFPWITFPMGGIKDGEDALEAGKREVKEETGYTNLKFVKVLDGVVRAEYFAAHKNENRVAYTTAVVFDLLDYKQEEISKKEKNNHKIIWLDRSQLNYENMTHAEVEVWNERLDSSNYAYEGKGIIFNSGKFNGMDSEKAKDEITKYVTGKKSVNYKLRDWIFSRQHYWGEPIPMIFCKKCASTGSAQAGWQTVPEKDLPVELPKVKKYQPTDTGESPLASIKDWVKVVCPECGQDARRETDTMPNWAGSNWYFIRYCDPKNNKRLADGKLMEYWLPVDWYNGGMEHTTLHLLYSRFIFKFLWDIGTVPQKIGSEPYKKRTSHGMVLGEGGIKMSKSKGNVINPDKVVKEYGADVLRGYEMFMGPFEQAIPWDTKGIIGVKRFLERIYNFVIKKGIAKKSSDNLKKLLNKTIKKVGEDIEAMKFNTGISSLMELANEWSLPEGSLDKRDLQKFLIIISPFFPHLAEELWSQMKFKGFCSMQKWPEFDKNLIKEKKILMIIQVNGKVRDKIEAESGISQKEAEKLAMESPKIRSWLEKVHPIKSSEAGVSSKMKQFDRLKKSIFIKDKLLNIVI